MLILTFLLLHTIPGGPFDQERVLPPEIEQNLYEKYGLQRRGDENFWVWFGKDLKSYLSYLTRGQLGPSLKYRDRDVSEMMARAIPPSAQLALYSLVLATIGGFFLGLCSARRPNGWPDRLFSFMSSLSVSLPGFVKAVILVMIFSFWLVWLPPALWEGLSYRILPVITLSATPTAYFIQLTRSGLLTQLKQDFIRTARAKGVPERTVLLKHAFKNVAQPLLTVLGPTAAGLITGSFVVETIFAIPGLGRHFVTAIIDRDYFLVMGITLFYAAILIVLNWMVDVGYLWLDPRMRKGVNRG
ncbi:MAG: ABC transporter permease [Deltaproteobacteria bacterium]|nr:ABC transporter permease [Deltaproteobacteria bacterium]